MRPSGRFLLLVTFLLLFLLLPFSEQRTISALQQQLLVIDSPPSSTKAKNIDEIPPPSFVEPPGASSAFLLYRGYSANLGVDDNIVEILEFTTVHPVSVSEEVDGRTPLLSLAFEGECLKRCISPSCSTVIIESSSSTSSVNRCIFKSKIIRQKNIQFQPSPSSDTYIMIYPWSSHNNRQGRRPQRMLSCSRGTFDRTSVFVLLTAAKYFHSRLLPALKSWLSNVPSVLFFDESLEARRNFSKHVTLNPEMESVRTCPVFLKPPSDRLIRYVRGAWKNLAILRFLQRQFFHPFTEKYVKYTSHITESNWKHPCAEFLQKLMCATAVDENLWFVFADDDTYIIQHNLQLVMDAVFPPRNCFNRSSSLHSTTRCSNHMRQQPLQQQDSDGEGVEEPPPHYLGVIPHWLGGANESFMQGGASMLLNHVAIHKLLTRFNDCYHQCNRYFGGDMRIGCCAKMVGISPNSFLREFFMMNTVDVSIVQDRREEVAPFPVSFHQLREAFEIAQFHRVVVESMERMAAEGILERTPVGWGGIVQAWS